VRANRTVKKLDVKKILVSGAGNARDRVQPILDQGWHEILSEERGSDALTRTAEESLHLIVVCLPLPDMPAEEFFTLIRGAFPSTPMLVLAGEHEIDALNAEMGDECVLVQRADCSEKDLRSATGRLLGVPKRCGTRVMVRFSFRADGEEVRRFCQARNISQTGVLIRSSFPLPEGGKVSFEIGLPEDARPLQGKAVVVRQTNPGVEGIEGAAFRFLYFHDGGERRLADYIKSLEND
jgi:hypothetical protein